MPEPLENRKKDRCAETKEPWVSSKGIRRKRKGNGWRARAESTARSAADPVDLHAAGKLGNARLDAGDAGLDG